MTTITGHFCAYCGVEMAMGQDFCDCSSLSRSTGSERLAIKTIEVIDHEATGYWHADMRKRCGVSLRELARRMGISAAYLSDLEHGKRNWNEKLAEKYEHSLFQNDEMRHRYSGQRC